MNESNRFVYYGETALQNGSKCEKWENEDPKFWVMGATNFVVHCFIIEIQLPYNVVLLTYFLNDI